MTSTWSAPASARSWPPRCSRWTPAATGCGGSCATLTRRWPCGSVGCGTRGPRRPLSRATEGPRPSPTRIGGGESPPSGPTHLPSESRRSWLGTGPATSPDFTPATNAATGPRCRCRATARCGYRSRPGSTPPCRPGAYALVDARVSELLEDPRHSPEPGHDDRTDQWGTTYGGGLGRILFAVFPQNRRVIVLRLPSPVRWVQAPGGWPGRMPRESTEHSPYAALFAVDRGPVQEVGGRPRTIVQVAAEYAPAEQKVTVLVPFIFAHPVADAALARAGENAADRYTVPSAPAPAPASIWPPRCAT